MYKRINIKYPGVTSLLFVLVIGLVLVVMVAGIAALTIREQQQASNTDLSNRALQTAESGVKIAVQKLISDPTYSKSGCTKEAPVDNYVSLSTTNQEISCITVQSVFKNYDSYLKKDSAEQLFMGPNFSDATASPSYIRVNWNNPSLGDVSSNFNYTGGLYPLTSYTNAATIEISLVYWVRNATVGDVRIKKFLLAPGNNNPADTAVKSVCSGQAGALTDLTDYKCSTTNGAGNSGGFDVKQAIGLGSTDSVANYNFSIIIKSRYKSTHVQVMSYDSSGTAQISMKSANAQIDSTARSGNLYRRVKASRSLGVSGGLENVLDEAIYSGMGSTDSVNLNICKNFSAIEDPASAGNYKWSGAGTSPNCNNLTL